ncbi:MAG TPA: LamG-like jellyroll fold domain-containing protein, partial [Pirellulaceae bacterium]|nr:LamG-like jellyroll fold domain-containing protein [Pirellulaceae bacterium]
MNRLASWLRSASINRSSARMLQNYRSRSRRLLLERLEDRQLLALISHWTADNTPADAVGTNHGSLISGATYAAGQIGQAFSFDGIDDRVQVADSDSLKLTASLSIEGWVKATGHASQHGMILFRGDDRGGLDPYWLSVEPNGQLVFVVENGTEGAGVSTTMPMNQFVHVAGTLDDATGALRLYVNGVLMSQIVTTVRPFGDLDPAFNPGIGIGNHGGYPNTPHNFPFDGLIDELKVYDHALSGEEVLNNFSAGKGALEPVVSVSDAAGVEGDMATKYLGNFVSPGEGGLDDPSMMIYGPDGMLYVSTRLANSVLRYDPATGLPAPAPGKPGAEFVSPGAAGLNSARGIAFGPDGNLYVAGTNSDAIFLFSGTTGEPVGDGLFVASGVGGLDQPRGLLFHSDGFLYVTSVGQTTSGDGVDSILRYDGLTGSPAGISGLPGDAVFIPSGTGGMDNPSQIVFHDNNFYVSSTSPSTSNSVLKFAPDGSFLGAFVPTGSGGLSGPVELVFRDGFLYVTSWTNNKVLRYSGTTGDFVDEVVSGGGLARPMGLVFQPNGDMLVASGDSDEIRRYGASSALVFTVSLGAPFPTAVSVDYATADGTALAGSDYVTTAGTITFAPGQTSGIIVVQTLDDTIYEPTETFTVNLSNPVGGVIADGQGVGTIIDNDQPPTKFYVVNDGSPDRTYEYGPTGAAVENYVIDSGNSAPRGAASTVAGDKVWVVDGNKKVFIYDTSGGLLGSWTAGSLANNADEQGIATNGTDVWIVDGKSDKVFRDTNAAGRLSGSQNAASSFSLNSGNRNPKDIVTDGVHLWVVNDTSTDKVFKYTLSGSLVGSWTISTSGATAPTGITLDPASPSHLWIVDSGSDRVY